MLGPEESSVPRRGLQTGLCPADPRRSHPRCRGLGDPQAFGVSGRFREQVAGGAGLVVRGLALGALRSAA